MKNKDKTYIVIGQETTDGEVIIRRYTADEIKKLSLYKSPDHCIVDGNVLKSFDGTWNLK